MTVHPTHVKMEDPVLMASMLSLVIVPQVIPEIPVKLVRKTFFFKLPNIYRLSWVLVGVAVSEIISLGVIWCDQKFHCPHEAIYHPLLHIKWITKNLIRLW